MANRLANETSPYLLQHADNPVDWYPWGPEALDRARSLDRPILLSIGYSACHWCHVMERESFEDSATAEFMNDHFVNVKVDREERPDVDAIYMRAVQALTGQGGWPLTAFLTPDTEPFFGGTYFPPVARQGMPSFGQVLRAAAAAYRDRREEVGQAAGQLRALLERSTRAAGPTEETPAPDVGVLDSATRAIGSRYDVANGGFGGAPKFPQPAVLEFLLRQHHRTGAAQTLEMVVGTLRRMARGGLRDQLDGGFHRYTVDARWLVPHFEKMLYDNALLSRVYLQTFQVTGDPELLEVATGAMDYCLDDLRDPEGGFYSARDADSEGEEGSFYLWTPEDVREVLGGDRAALFQRVYDVSASGNFEGRNILHVPHDVEAIARSEGLGTETLARRLAEDRAALLSARSQRVHPMRDEKVLTGWNGMLLRTLAEAGGALSRPDYTRAAATGVDFLLDRLRDDDRLFHTWKDGQARIPGFLEDYAALGNAALALHEVSLDPGRLTAVRWCCDRILERFVEPATGLLFDTPNDGEELLVRPRETMDNATPSGTSLAAELLLRSAVVFGHEPYRQVAMTALSAEAPAMRQYPQGFGRLLSCLDFALAGAVEVALIGPPDDPATRDLQSTVLRRYLPNRVLVASDGSETAGSTLPLLEGRGMVQSHPTAYVCRGYACGLPATDVAGLRDQLP